MEVEIVLLTTHTEGLAANVYDKIKGKLVFDTDSCKVVEHEVIPTIKIAETMHNIEYLLCGRNSNFVAIIKDDESLPSFISVHNIKEINIIK